MLRKVISRDYILALLSSGLLVLSFPRFNFWMCAWVGFIPLLVALRGKSKIQSFLLAYGTGLVFWIGTIYWLVHVTLLGTILLVIYLALYFGLFGLFISTCLPSTCCCLLLFVPTLWVLLEYARSHLLTGFPWVLLGYSQYLNLPVIQIADITGVWGVSFLIMVVNTAVYSAISRQLSVISKRKACAVAALTLLFALGYGYYKLYRMPQTLPANHAGEERTVIKISVIQGNIPQDMKWDPRKKDFIMGQYLGLSRQAAQEEPGLIIWPEAALPAVPEEEPAYHQTVVEVSRQIHIPVLFGAVTCRGGRYYNSALLVSGPGGVIGYYDKVHLVPFGEYIPALKVFSFLQTIVPIGEITSGRDYTIFRQPASFSVLICFEDLFPQLSRRFVQQGASFLVNITNDAWYKKTAAAEQHFQASVFRAVENRLFLVRAANTGISGFIAPDGRIISQVRDGSGQIIFVRGYGSERIFAKTDPLTFYTRWGDAFILLLSLGIIYGIVHFVFQRK